MASWAAFIQSLIILARTDVDARTVGNYTIATPDPQGPGVRFFPIVVVVSVAAQTGSLTSPATISVGVDSGSSFVDILAATALPSTLSGVGVSFTYLAEARNGAPDGSLPIVCRVHTAAVVGGGTPVQRLNVAVFGAQYPLA
jgi:hypothetical protein